MTRGSLLFGLGLSVGLVVVAATGSSVAQTRDATPPPGKNSTRKAWTQVKCERYRKAWTQATAHFGTAGLSDDFLARHRAFIDSDCSGPHDVCPRSDEEFAIADAMVIAALNGGMASTFPPFGCPRKSP